MRAEGPRDNHRARVGPSVGRTRRCCRRRPGGRGSSLEFPRRPRQARAASGAPGAAPALRAQSAGKHRTRGPGSALTMVRPQVGRTTLWLRWGSGCGPRKRSSGRSGPAAPDRSLRRFASCQDGGPKPRLQPETARVKGWGAGPAGKSWVPV